MYLYETHLHTSPVSKCALWSVREAVQYYKDAGYAGIFITNHFIDGHINISKDRPYEERINYYFSDAEEGIRIGKEIGLPVFTGVEMSHFGTDFLVYGLAARTARASALFRAQRPSMSSRGSALPRT